MISPVQSEDPCRQSWGSYDVLFWLYSTEFSYHCLEILLWFTKWVYSNSISYVADPYCWQLCQNVQGGDGFNHYKVRARMAIMEKNFKLAESIYLEQVWLQQLANIFNTILFLLYSVYTKNNYVLA